MLLSSYRVCGQHFEVHQPKSIVQPRLLLLLITGYSLFTCKDKMIPASAVRILWILWTKIMLVIVAITDGGGGRGEA